MKPTPLTSTEKARRRVDSLNEIAHQLGFSSWRKLETQIKKGRYVVVPLSKWIQKDKSHETR